MSLRAPPPRSGTFGERLIRKFWNFLDRYISGSDFPRGEAGEASPPRRSCSPPRNLQLFKREVWSCLPEASSCLPGGSNHHPGEKIPGKTLQRRTFYKGFFEKVIRMKSKNPYEYGDQKPRIVLPRLFSLLFWLTAIWLLWLYLSIIIFL